MPRSALLTAMAVRCTACLKISDNRVNNISGSFSGCLKLGFEYVTGGALDQLRNGASESALATTTMA